MNTQHHRLDTTSILLIPSNQPSLLSLSSTSASAEKREQLWLVIIIIIMINRPESTVIVYNRVQWFRMQKGITEHLNGSLAWITSIFMQTPHPLSCSIREFILILTLTFRSFVHSLLLHHQPTSWIRKKQQRRGRHVHPVADYNGIERREGNKRPCRWILWLRFLLPFDGEEISIKFKQEEESAWQCWI